MKKTLEEAMKEHMLSVFRVAYAVLNDRHDSEDVAQDTFLAYYMTSEEFESEEHIRRWLLAVAVNKAKNLVKSAWKRKNRPMEELENTEELGSAVAFSTQEDRNLLEAVAELPLKCRTVIHLFYYEDYKVKEIADMLNVSENTVKSQLHRGRKLLKARLREEWEDE
jgi:RNA polymerase sigma-70 factor (ECF subfamily)